MNLDAVGHPQYLRQTQSQVPGRVDSAMVPYKMNYAKELPLRLNEPYNSQPIPTAFAEVVEQIIGRIVRDVDNDNSWELALANVQSTTSMQFETVVKRFDNFVLERNAPNSAFSIVDMKKESHVVTLERFNLGIEVDGELMNTSAGLQMLQDHMDTFRDALIRTQRMLIQAAIINAESYWTQDFGVRIHRNMTSIQDFTEQEVLMFGAITQDPKGLQKMHALLMEWTQGRPGAPTFNLAVVPYQAALQHAWRHDYPTEAWRAGDAAAARNLQATSPTNLLDQALPMPVYISKPINAVNLGDGMDVDTFARVATVGGYTVIQGTDSGPVDDTYLVRIPTIRTPTADVNGYAEFSIRDCIMNCPRFDAEDGTIDAFTGNLIDNSMNQIERWGSGKLTLETIDPFVAVYKSSGYGDQTKAVVCKNFGEQHERYRPKEFDIKQGILFKNFLKLTEDEQSQLDLLLQAAQDLYEIPVNDQTAELIKNIMDATSDGYDEEWGAPYLTAAYDGKPYGFGDIFAVMALLKRKPSGQDWDETWPLGNKLNYNTLRRVLYRIYRAAREVFPEVHRHDSLPFYRKPTSEENRKMVLLFRGWLERAKFPLWDKENEAGRSLKVRTDNSNDTAVQTLEDNEDALKFLISSGAANLSGNELFEFLTTKETQGKYEELFSRLSSRGSNTIYGEIGRLIAGVTVVGDKIVATQVAFALSHMLRMLEDGTVSDYPAFSKELERFFLSAGRHAQTRGLKDDSTPWRKAATGDNEFTTKGLTVWREAFNANAADAKMSGSDTGKYFVPTNALIGDVPVGERTDTNDVLPHTYAQAQFGASQSDSQKHFGYDSRQFITSTSVNSIGGPFMEEVVFDGDAGLQFKERPNISERCLYVADKHAENPLARLGSFLFLFSKVTRKAVLSIVEHGLCSPMNFILAWPFIRVRTHAMLFAEAGPDTLQLRFGFSDMSTPVDAVHKLEYRHFSTYMAANVTDPVKLFIIEDAALSGYQSGLSSSFIPADQLINPDEFDPEQYDGLFAIDAPVTFTRTTAIKEKHNPIPLTGYYNEARYNIGNFSNRDHIFKPALPHFPTFPAYDAHYGFSDINDAVGAAYRRDSFMALKQSKYVPAEMYLKRTQVFNPTSKKGGNWTINDGGTQGTGHLDKIDPLVQDFKAALGGRIEFKKHQD